MVVVLHSIRSLHNVGSIFRTADAVGVEKIYLGGITPAPVDRFGKVRRHFAKVALGAEKYVEWEKYNATRRLLGKLKKDSYKIFAVEQSKKSIPYYRISKSYILYSKFCLIFGNERTGLTPSILKLADKILEIPMRGKKESLNVSVAAGVVLFSIVNSGK